MPSPQLLSMIIHVHLLILRYECVEGLSLLEMQRIL
jgi:hypothetical protein